MIFSTKTRWFVALLLAAALFFGGCSHDSDDDDSSSSSLSSSSSSSSSSVTLPESSGTNEFSGKTFTRTTEHKTETVKFDSSSLTLIESDNNETWILTYRYSYDSSNKLLYMALSSISDDTGVIFSSASEYEAAVATKTGAELELDVASYQFMFTTVETQQYSLSGSTLTITDYFDGSLPTLCYFENSEDTAYRSAELRDNIFELDTNDSNNTHYYVVPTFSSNNTFTGTLYKRVRDSGNKVYSKLDSTANGTYSISGTGTSGSTITLTFTAPSEITGIATEFSLTQESDPEEYTLEQ